MEPAAKMPRLDTTLEKDSDLRKADKPQKEVALTYDILRLIFKFLCAKDLCTVSMICRVWRDAASSELASRIAPEKLLKTFQLTNEVDNSTDSYNAKHLGKDLRIKPLLGLLCTKVEDEWTPKGCYCENLPKSCNLVDLGGYDIVSDNSKIEHKLGIGVSAFLPQIPKLKSKIFQMKRAELDASSRKDCIAKVTTIVNKLLPTTHEKEKCIIILRSHEDYGFTDCVMKKLKERYKVGTISLWGGVCIHLKLCLKSGSSNVCSESVCWAAITLSGPTLRSWSIVLSESCRDEADMEEILERFKSDIQLNKHSLGLMFACCERMDRKDIEIRVFQKVFPKVPLIGLHGDGEFGLNSLSKTRERLEHAYSTTFLILTYNV